MKTPEVSCLPETVVYVFDQLDKFDVFYWLDAGSLLKGVRDKDILNSSDIDIAVFGEEIDLILKSISSIESAGYKIQYNGGYPMLEDLITIYLPESINRINT